MNETLPMVWPDEARTRRTDPTTSHAAADTNDTAASRRAVLTILAGTNKPLADFEIEQVHRTYTSTPFTGQRLRSARAELVRRKAVVHDGETRSPHGLKTQTWRLA